MPELLNTLDGLIVAALVLTAFGLTVRYLWRAVRPAAPNAPQHSGEQTACSNCRVPGVNSAANKESLS